MESITLIQITLELWGACFTFICAGIAFLGRKEADRRGVLMTYLLTVDTILLVSDAVAWFCSGVMTMAATVLNYISNFLVFALLPVIVVLAAFYIAVMSGPQGIHKNARLVHSIMGLGILYMVLVIVSQFKHFIYYIDESNVYHRLPGYTWIAILALIMMILLMVLLIRIRNRIEQNEMIAFLCFIFLPVVTNILQWLHYGISLNNIAVTISLLLLFLVYEVSRSRQFIQEEQRNMRIEMELAKNQAELMKKDAELAQKQVQISISQMRPHFIFNALGSIEQLCRIDPPTAAEATSNFARYLRKNINAMGTSELVSLKEELEHVRAYVWLEKMRFGDEFEFEEDIQVTECHLPALSLQPLVENAIKHGMSQDTYDVLHVSLVARDEEDAYVICVTDDGEGFDTSVPIDTTKHIGVSNVISRIEQMAKGRVEIESEVGKGTAISIIIPKA